MGLFNWKKVVFKKMICVDYLKLCNTLFWIDVYVAIHKLVVLYEIWVSATPYCNYSLLCILLLDVFCSTFWNLVEYKILFPVAIICCILTIRYCIGYDFHEMLLIKLTIVEYNYGYCKKCYWLCQLLYSLKYFLSDVTYKIECCWVLSVLYCSD